MSVRCSLDRTWEKIETTNLALDFTILNNRLSGTVEAFLKNNVNMLLPVTYPAVLGATAPSQNIGYLRTKGWEMTLNWADRIGQFQYHLGGTLTYNRNNLINYGGQTLIVQGINAATQGQPLNSIYGLKYAGRIQTQAQLTDYVNKYLTGNTVGLPSTLRIGDNMFEDVNGDGKLTNADFVNLGTEDPR